VASLKSYKAGAKAIDIACMTLYTKAGKKELCSYVLIST